MDFTYRGFKIELHYICPHWTWIIGDGSGMGDAPTKEEALKQAHEWVNKFIKTHKE